MSIQKGLCVSRGTSTGVAYVIQGNDIVPDNLPSNTILVAEALSRDLVKNLNTNIVGVVAEHGNIGSHGAGILRQLKIPCVIRIPDITEKIKNGMHIKICGSDNCIIIDDLASSGMLSDYLGNQDLRYRDIARDSFGQKDIRIRLEWVCLRPKRFYHKLRYDMICDTFAHSCSFLYGTPAGQTKLDSNGAIVAYGLPYISDLCSFILCNPSWFLQKVNERTLVFEGIKQQLSQLKPYTDSDSIENVEYVFEKGIRLYQSLFRYSFLSQFIADELLEVYLDFVKNLTGVTDTKDILNLYSSYVQESLSSAEKLGDAQRWLTVQCLPRIWNGTLDYSPLPSDSTIIEAIEAHPDKKDKLQLDYEAFRVVIPLVYQMSEEFFYLSSCINSFVTWSISHLYDQLYRTGLIRLTQSEFYEQSLNDVWVYLRNLKELNLQ